MDMIEKLLGEANRLFEETVRYKPAGAETFGEPVPATRESIDSADFSADGARDAWRLIAFSFRRADLTDGEGNPVTPRRGDRLRAKDGTYRLVEYGGLACTPRFDAGFADRVLIYFERESADAGDQDP